MLSVLGRAALRGFVELISALQERKVRQWKEGIRPKPWGIASIASWREKREWKESLSGDRHKAKDRKAGL